MATGKKYYWIKLKDSFLTSDKVDFLMSQKDGANYIVLYQMLCLKSINTDGALSRTIGEVLIPFDEEKIQRDCKYFSIDTIRIALNLYKRLGMVYVNEEGVLQIEDFENLVGCETDYSSQKRIQRKKKMCGQIVDSSVDNVHTDIEIRDRDKEIDKRDKEIEKDKEIKNKKIKDKEAPMYFPDEKLNQTFLDYIAMRNKIKKPLTDHAIDLVIKKLIDLATVPFSDGVVDPDMEIKILEQSIMNSWQGLFPLKTDNQSKQGKQSIDWSTV